MTGVAGSTVVAAFDVDGTLTTRDCVVPFLRRFAGRPAAWFGAVRELPATVVALARRDRDRLKAAATRALLTGVPLADVEREAEQFARTVIAGRLRDDTTARLRWHVEQGHRILLVSASYEVYLNHLAAHLGAEAVLATRLEVGRDGHLTGRLDGPNCRAAEKACRLDEWFAEKLGRDGLDRAGVELWAYGDSSGDAELLAIADRAVWVRDPLASVAPT